MGQDQVSGGVRILCWLAAPKWALYIRKLSTGNRKANDSLPVSFMCMSTRGATVTDARLSWAFVVRGFLSMIYKQSLKATKNTERLKFQDF